MYENDIETIKKAQEGDKTELEKFLESILTNTKPEVSIEDGYKVLDVAHQIIMKIQNNLLQIIWFL